MARLRACDWAGVAFTAVALTGGCKTVGGDDGGPGEGDGGGDGAPIPEVGLVCEGSEEMDVSAPDATISGEDCNEAAIRSAVEAGGIVVIDCAQPVMFSSEMTVSADTTIDGSGTTVLDGGGVTRLITKIPGPWLHLQNITLQGGQAPEALGDSQVTGENWFRWAGGAINAQCFDDGVSPAGGGISGKRLTCTDNATGSHTRDPSSGRILDTGNGGCLYAFHCEFSCDECEFSNNRATNGGAIGALGAKTRLTNSTCTSNEARYDESDNDNRGCGGCYCQDGTEQGPGTEAENYVHFCGNVFANNRADESGGAVSVFYRQGTHTSLHFRKNSCQGNESGMAGLPTNSGGCFTVFVDPNTKLDWAPDVGPDEFVFSGNAIYDNTSFQAGGGASIFNIWNTAVRFDNNLFLRNRITSTDNSTGGGGALYLLGTFFDLDHNTFIGNEAASSSGGIGHGAGGTGLRNNLFFDNRAPIPGQGPMVSEAEHVHSYLDETDDGMDAGFKVFASEGNLYFPTTNANGGPRPTPGAASTEEPRVGMLVIDDGFPPYVPLPADSPAVDAGSVLETVSHDIRGVPRDDSPDIGAYEAMR